MNNMKAIFLVGAVQAFFLAILLFSKKNKITADIILAIWLIVTGIPLLLYFINYESYSEVLNFSESIPTYLMLINIPLLLIQAPFLFIYVSYILKNIKSFNPIYLLHFIPVIAFILIYWVIIGFNNYPYESFNLYAHKYYGFILMFFPLTILSAFFYIFRSYTRLKKYKTNLYKQFSYTENIDFRWLRNLILITLFVWIIFSFSSFLFSKYHTKINIHDIDLIAISIAIFVLGYFGFLRTDIFISVDLSDELKPAEKNEKKKIIVPDVEKQINELKAYMENKKPYLQSKLTIKQLADMLSIQSYQLSVILNDHLKKNFFDFINEYRIEEVKNEIKYNKNYTLLGIAYDCGFNSKSSFNRIFKNYTGLTPSEYLKETIS
jgi:AraC-like DNA-binding protein